MKAKRGIMAAAAFFAVTAAYGRGEWDLPDVSPGHKRENIEWQLSYSYHVTDTNKCLPRVLLLGDSICNGYQTSVAKILEGKVNVTYWVTSKSVTDVSYLKYLSLFLDEYDYQVIHFNNGLHSLSVDPAVYERCLRAAIRLIKAKAKGAKIVWASSTPLMLADRTAVVRKLNGIAARIMREEGVPTNDLFALMDPLDRKEHWRDVYHFKPSAVYRQAKQVSEVVLAQLKTAAPTCADAKAPDYTTLISHRGESADAPENTLPAYRTAVERGFGFECDIYLSKDKKLFTFHDGTLTRTTGGANTNRCTDVDWETVSKLNVGGWGKWKGSRFDPTRPALLSEVLDLARDGRWIYVEVKGNDPAWVPYIRETFARSKKANPGNVLFISFGRKVCAELKRQMPEYRVYWLTGSSSKGKDGVKRVRTPAEIVAQLRAIGADGVDICFDAEVIDAAYVKAVRDAGFAFHVWTVDDPEVAKRAFAVGAETLTTNRAQFIYEACSGASR